MQQVLTQQHILLLAGSRSSGRFTSSVALAQRIEVTRTRLVGALDRQMRIDLRDTMGTPEFRGCLTIFRDVFDGSNSDILRLFSSLDGHGCDELRRTLQDNGAYLIFTTTAPQLRRYAPRIIDLDIHQEVGHTPPEILAEALVRRLDRERENGAAGWQDALRAETDSVATHFHSVGSLNRAVDSFSRHWIPGQSVVDYLRHYRSLGYFRSILAKKGRRPPGRIRSSGPSAWTRAARSR